MNGAKTLTVVAILKAKAGSEDDLRRELLSAVNPSRKDAGCVNYDLHESAGTPGVFMFHENWASKAQLDQHLAKPDLQAVLGRAAKLVSEPPQILLWNKIG